MPNTTEVNGTFALLKAFKKNPQTFAVLKNSFPGFIFSFLRAWIDLF